MNTYKIRKCGGRRCGTCPFVNDCNNFFSNSTNIRYLPNTAGLNYLDCKTENVVYLISCKICNFCKSWSKLIDQIASKLEQCSCTLAPQYCNLPPFHQDHQ